jgi:hypothetical protein
VRYDPSCLSPFPFYLELLLSKLSPFCVQTKSFTMGPLILFFLTLFRFVASATVTLTEADAYQSQRPCAKTCFYLGAFSGPDELAQQIGCSMKDIENECLCRPDLQAGADSYLKSCVSSACAKNTLDVNSAVSIYDAYCTSAGFQRDSTPASTTSGTDSTPTVTVTAIQTVFVKSGARQLRPPLVAWAERLRKLGG